MQSNLSTTVAGAPKQRRTLSPLAIGGAALVLAAAAGLATWQGIARRETSAPVTESSVVAIAPATAQLAGATPLSTDLTVYLVGSQSEAARVMGVIAAGDRLRDQFGNPPFNAQVVVVTSAEEEAAIERAHADTNSYRAGMGLPALESIDLRAR